MFYVNKMKKLLFALAFLTVVGCMKDEFITEIDSVIPELEIEGAIGMKFYSSNISDTDMFNIKSPEEIEHKLKSYLHHREFDLEPLSTDGIKKIMENKQAIYDLRVDKTVNKIGTGDKLEKYSLEKLPEIIKLNLEKYRKWLD